MMAVLIDRNARTAIVVGQGRKYTRVVPMEEGELVIRELSLDDMRDRQFRELPDYPVKRAVNKYLKHSGGVSTKARAALKAAKEAT